MLKSSLSDYSDVYRPVQGTILIAAQGGDNPNNGDKEVVFKNCCEICEINNTQVDNSKDFDIVMLMYNLIEYINSTQKYKEVCGNTIERNQL